MQRRRRLIDVPAILDAALALVDEHGQFTMAELAARLGTSASSIYHHVSGRDEIVELLRDRLDNTEDLPAAEAGDWATALPALLRAYRRALAEHPNLIPLLISQPMTAGTALRWYDRVAGLLAAAGLPGDEVIVWLTVLDSYTVGAAFELTSPEDVWASGGGGTPALDAAVQAGPRGRSRADAAFEAGLAALVAGIRARLAADAVI
ncbi:TetR/AcrR family transcriptional regulator [Blastococcus sp. SYSU D00820]